MISGIGLDPDQMPNKIDMPDRCAFYQNKDQEDKVKCILYAFLVKSRGSICTTKVSTSMHNKLIYKALDSGSLPQSRYASCTTIF